MKQSVSVRRTIRYEHIAVDAYTIDAYPPSQAIPATDGGTVTAANLLNSAIRLRVLYGGVQQSGWDFSGTTVTGAAFTITNNTDSATIRLTAFSLDKVQIAITATKPNCPELQTVVCFIKQKQGGPGQDGKPGADGSAGAWIPPARRWSDYPSTYQFQCGNVANGEDRCDIVLHDTPNEDGTYNAYRCKSSHRKNSNLLPWSASSTVWAPADLQTVKLISTDLLLANKAFIGLAGTNGVRIYDNEANIVGQFAGFGVGLYPKKFSIGTVPYNLPFFIGGILGSDNRFETNPNIAFDNQGKIYSGGLDGQHIEIDPISKQIQIFDADGQLCTTLSGNKLSVEDVTSSTSTSTTNMTGTSLATTSTLRSAQRDGTAFTCNSGGMLLVSVSGFTLRGVKGSGFPQTVDTIRKTEGVTATLEVLKNSAVVASFTIAHLDLTGIDGSSTSVTIDSQTYWIPVQKGDSMSVRIKLTGNHSSGGNGSLSGNQCATAVRTNYYRCVYGANGFFICRGNQNYIYAIFDDSGVLQCDIVSEGKSIFAKNTD